MNPNLNATLSALRVLLITIGSVMADQGLAHSTAYSYVMMAAGSIMVIGPAVWAVWSSIVNWRKAASVGAQSTLNMVAANKAIDVNGNVVSQIGPDTTPFKPVTESTTVDIIKNFPPASPIAKV